MKIDALEAHPNSRSHVLEYMTKQIDDANTCAKLEQNDVAFLNSLIVKRAGKNGKEEKDVLSVQKIEEGSAVKVMDRRQSR